MATRGFTPRADGEGSLGTEKKKWGAVFAKFLNGLASEASKVTNKLIINGAEYDGSKAVTINTPTADDLNALAGKVGNHLADVTRTGKVMSFTKADKTKEEIQINNFDVIQLKDATTGKATYIYANNGGLFYTDTDPTAEGSK